MNILFVVNPSSGNQWQKNMEKQISGFMENQDLSWDIIQTKGSGDSARIQDAIARLKPEKVVAAGGDGTLNLVAGHLLNKKIPLGIIPAGSANGLAYNLEIPSDVNKALQKILKNRARAIDVLLLNDNHHCLHLADVGLNARVVKRFEEEGSGGIGGYALHMVKELISKKKSVRFRLKNSPHTKEMKAEMLVISNAKSYGTGALINPKGKIDDGKFEIVLIKPYPWWYLLWLVLSAFTGKLHKMENVITLSTDEAHIAFKKPVDLQVDGEVVEGLRDLKVNLLPGALQVIY